MRISNVTLPGAIVSLSLLSLTGLLAHAQTPPAAKPAAQPASAPPPPPSATPAPAAATPGGPGAALQVALTAVQQTVSSINVEKWKKGNVREEAGDHIGVITRDLKDTMPSLITAADAAPDSASAAAWAA